MTTAILESIEELRKRALLSRKLRDQNRDTELEREEGELSANETPNDAGTSSPHSSEAAFAAKNTQETAVLQAKITATVDYEQSNSNGSFKKFYKKAKRTGPSSFNDLDENFSKKNIHLASRQRNNSRLDATDGSSAADLDYCVLELDEPADDHTLLEGDDAHRRMILSNSNSFENTSTNTASAGANGSWTPIAKELISKELIKQNELLSQQTIKISELEAKESEISSKINENEILIEKGLQKIKELKEQMRLTKMITGRCTQMKKSLLAESQAIRLKKEKLSKNADSLKQSILNKEKSLGKTKKSMEFKETDESPQDSFDSPIFSDASEYAEDSSEDSLATGPVRRSARLDVPSKSQIPLKRRRSRRSSFKIPQNTSCDSAAQEEPDSSLKQPYVMISKMKRRLSRNLKPLDPLTVFENHLVNVHKQILVEYVHKPSILPFDRTVSRTKYSDDTVIDLGTLRQRIHRIATLSENERMSSFWHADAPTVSILYQGEAFIQPISSIKFLFENIPFTPADSQPKNDSCNGAIRQYDINKPFCSHELLGACNDHFCGYQHFKHALRGTEDAADIKICDFLDSKVWAILKTKAAAVTFLSKTLEQLERTTGINCSFKMFSNYLDNVKENILLNPLMKAATTNAAENIKKMTLNPLFEHSKAQFFIKELDSIFKENSKDRRYFENTLDSTKLNLQKVSAAALQEALNGLQFIEGSKLDSSSKFDNYLHILSRCLESQPENEEVWLLYLDVFVLNRSQEEIKKIFEQAVTHVPHSIPLWWKYFSVLKGFEDKENLLRRMFSGVATFSSQDRSMSSELAFDVILQLTKLYLDAGYTNNCLGWLGAMLNEPYAANSDFCDRWTKMPVTMFSLLPSSFNMKIEQSAIAGIIDMNYVTSLFMFFLHILEHKTYLTDLFYPIPYDFTAKRNLLYVINWNPGKKRTKITNSILSRLLEFNATTEIGSRSAFVMVLYNVAALIKMECTLERRNELVQILYEYSRKYWFFPEVHGILADIELV